MKLASFDDVILGMDWMRRYGAVLDMKRKVTVTADDGTEHVCRGEEPKERGPVVSMVRAARLLKDGCVGYWCFLYKREKEEVSISSIPVVREFEDVFPKDLPGLPP